MLKGSEPVPKDRNVEKWQMADTTLVEVGDDGRVNHLIVNITSWFIAGS